MRRLHRVPLRAALRRMPRIRRKPPGTAPGTISVDPEAPPPIITVTAYGPDDLAERRLGSVEAIDELLTDRWRVVWLNVDGLGCPKTIAWIGERFGIHQLALEDVTNVHQRAKVEPYEDHLFVIGRMARMTATPVGPQLETEQVSIIVGPAFVITFQEREGDDFELIRQRLRAGRPNIRGEGPGYLCYALLDAIVDAYYPLLETLSERLQQLESRLLDHPDRDVVEQLHQIKHELLTLRRAAWPHREAVASLLRDDTPFINKRTRVFLRDVYDHVVQLVDLIETYREIASSLMDLYLSSLSHRMNEIMKVLTIFAAIFIPLSFIAGVFGMNFDPDASPWNMPELDWRYGYPVALGLMAVVALGLLAYFRFKGWIGR